MPPCISENVTVYWVMLFKNSRKFKFITALIVLAVLIAALGMSCTSRDDINHQVNTIVKGYVFSIAGWEVKTLWNEAKSPDGITAVTAEDIATVEQYFELTAQLNALKAKRNANQAVNGSGGLSPQDAENEAALQAQRDALKGRVEAVIERQIRDTLKENGIYNPFFGKGSFPPVDFTISTPPNLLIISPREKIERTRDIMLLPDLTDEEIESLERQTSALGISTIIEPLGGLGATFPTFVQNDAGLQFTINCAVEEWLHQYLA
ncbi:MAG: hypothetical protein JW967_00910, partial [Dehalococcoidales bacterium]|nr:hypothetical protein [Dehalococcoidales bacterium]